MNLTLPDWVPWWVPLLLLLPALLYGLAFLFMPFSVIGLKSRLEAIDARLDDIQQELRNLTVRRGAGAMASSDYDDVYVPVPVVPRQAEREPMAERPPIPPPAHTLHDDAPEDQPPPPPHMRPIRRGEPTPGSRQEPRVNWPR